MTFKSWMCHPSWPLRSWRGLMTMRLKPKGKSVFVHTLVKVTTHQSLLLRFQCFLHPTVLLSIYSKLCICLCSVGGDDFLVVHTRDDCAALHGTTPYTHSNLGTPINMPWLGGAQTGRGASVVSLTTEFGWSIFANVCHPHSVLHAFSE